MRGKSRRGGGVAVKPPHPSLSPTHGPMNRYMTHGGDGEGATSAAEKQQNTKGRQSEKKEKKGHTKTLLDSSTISEMREDQELELDPPTRVEQQNTVQLPTKTDMERMFAALENSLKTEMAVIHKDMGHMLERVEKVEKKTDFHAKMIKELKGEIKTLKLEHKEQAYRAEDQENRDRRKNLRIRGLPEPSQTENLKEVIGRVFNPIILKEESNEIKIERVHRIRRPQGMSIDIPRDIIVRFESWEVKNHIWRNLKGKSPITFEGKEIQIFQDLSQETLRRRRTLKPLLKILQEQEIQLQLGLSSMPDSKKKGKNYQTKIH